MPRPRLVLRSPTGEVLRNASGEVFAVEAPGIHLIQRAAPLRTNNSSDITPYGFASDVRAGSLLTLQIANYLTGISSITDTRGNTWQRAATNGDDSNFAEIWYAENAAPGPTTLSIFPTSTGLNYLSATLGEWGGVVSSGALDVIGASSGPPTSTSGPTTVTETLALLAVVADVGVNPTGYVAPTDWTLDDTAQNSTFDSGFLAAHRIATSIGVQTATGWNPSATSSEAVIATFKAAYPNTAGDLSASRTETTTPTDTASATATKAATRTETTTPTDTAGATTARLASATEETPPTDSTAGALSSPASRTETTTPTDTAPAVLNAGATVAETMSVADTADAATAGDYLASALESMAVTDQATKSTAFASTRADSLGVADTADASFAAPGQFVAALLESLGISDTSSSLSSAFATGSDAIAVTDTTAPFRAYLATVAEFAAPVESANGTVDAVGAGLSEWWWFTVRRDGMTYRVPRGGLTFTINKAEP